MIYQFGQRVGSGKSLFFTRLTMHATTTETQHQVQNGPVALSSVWRLDIVCLSPQSSLQLDLGFSSPLFHVICMKALLIDQQKINIKVCGVKSCMV